MTIEERAREYAKETLSFANDFKYYSDEVERDFLAGAAAVLTDAIPLVAGLTYYKDNGEYRSIAQNVVQQWSDKYGEKV